MSLDHADQVMMGLNLVVLIAIIPELQAFSSVVKRQSWVMPEALRAMPVTTRLWSRRSFSSHGVHAVVPGIPHFICG